MASTHKLIEAWVWAKRFLRNMPLEDIQIDILQDALNDLWMAAPWRWSLGAFAPITITANQSDQTISSMPTDFLYIVKASMTDGQVRRPLHPESFLSPNQTLGGPESNKIAFIAGTPNNFRLDPVPTVLPNANFWNLFVQYKKQAPILTPQNIRTAGTQVFDDEWFTTYKLGVLMYAYLWGDDQRGGGVTYAEGKSQASGAVGTYLAWVERMKQSEPLLTVAEDKNQGERRVG